MTNDRRSGPRTGRGDGEIGLFSVDDTDFAQSLGNSLDGRKWRSAPPKRGERAARSKAACAGRHGGAHARIIEDRARTAQSSEWSAPRALVGRFLEVAVG